MRISLLMGGTSSERDVSLASGLRISAALRSRGHQVTVIDTARGTLSEDEEQRMRTSGVVRTRPPGQEELSRLTASTLSETIGRLPARGDADVVFLGLHGGQGEDGTVQALLDLAGVPYTGSGHLASALAMDKDLSKRLFREAGVSTPDWLMAPVDEDKAIGAFGLPLIVKPSKEGSTVGLTLVKERAQLEGAVAEAHRYDDEIMLEQYIPGRELTVGVLGGEALPVGEIIPQHEIYDYECKYTAGMAREEFPARLTAEQTAMVQGEACRAYRALKLSGCARIDFRMKKDGRFYCLEANTLPGMTEFSLIPQAAAAAGVGFAELCERIALLALRQTGTGESR